MPKSKFPIPISRRRMSGILQKPIENPSDILLAMMAHGSSEEIQKQILEMKKNYIAKQRAERIEAAAQHYSIDLGEQNAFALLALDLASDFIVGFRRDDDPLIQGHRVGRKKGSTTIDPIALLIEVTQLKHRGNSSANACRLLSQQRNGPWHGKSFRGLLEAYNRSNKIWANSSVRRKSHPLYGPIERLVAQHKLSKS